MAWIRAGGRVTPRAAAVALGLFLTTGAIGLHLAYYAHAGALWRDEVNSVNLATLPSLEEVVANRHLDTFGLPWIALLHGWTSLGLGDSDAGLRRFGLLLGLTLLPTLWWSARRLGLDAPLASLLLYAMSPSVIVYGDSLRGYGAGAVALLWCLGSVWALLSWPTPIRFALAQLSALLAVQTYFPNAILLAALCAGAAAVCARRRTWKLLLGVAGLGLVAAMSMAVNRAWIENAFQIGALEQQSPSLLHLLRVFRAAPAAGIATLDVAWIAAGVLAMVGCGRAMWAGQESDRDRAIFAATASAVALAGYFFYLHDIARLPTQYWYYLSLLALLALACEVGLDLLVGHRRWALWARLAIVAILALPVARGVAQAVAVRMTNLDRVAQGLAAAAGPRDLIVVVPWVAGITFQRYWQGGAPWITVPDFDDHRFHLHLALKEKMRLGDEGIAGELERVERTLREGGRVWLVGQPLLPAGDEPPPRLLPAPKAATGWRAAPYLNGWEAQLGAMLQRRSRVVRRVELPDPGPVNAWENLPVFVIEGWR